MKTLRPAEGFENRIYMIRGYRVMLDADLAAIYGTSTGRINEQVRRNGKRFPSDFMFQLSSIEFENLISQIAISSSGWGGRRRPPMAFTQEGVAMLSGVLHTPRAIEANIAIMRTFVKLRETLALHKELAFKLAELERRIVGHDVDIRSVFDALEELRPLVKEPPKEIGFRPEP